MRCERCEPDYCACADFYGGRMHYWKGELMADFLAQLRRINSARLAVWEGDNPAGALFHALELGGEAGEVLNVAKKLHREAMGWRGSRATVTDLADELADVIICIDKLALQYGIDLEAATIRKFEATSEKNGFPHKFSSRCAHCGAGLGHNSDTCAPPFKIQPHQWSTHL